MNCRRSWRVFLLITIVFVCGCNSTTEPSKYADQLFPLAVGNSWIYQTTTFDVSGSVISTKQDTLRIVSDTVIDLTHWYTIKQTNNILTLGGTYSNRSDGLWALTTIFPDSLIPELFYPYPTHRGDTTIQRHDRTVVTAVDTAFAVPSGSYHTVGYSIEGTTYLYFTKGTGLVRSEWWYSAPKYYKWLQFELVSSHLQ